MYAVRSTRSTGRRHRHEPLRSRVFPYGDAEGLRTDGRLRGRRVSTGPVASRASRSTRRVTSSSARPCTPGGSFVRGSGRRSTATGCGCAGATRRCREARSRRGRPEDGAGIRGKDSSDPSSRTGTPAARARGLAPSGPGSREFTVDGVVAVGGRIVVGGTVKNSPTSRASPCTARRHGRLGGLADRTSERRALVRLSGFGGTPALVPDGAGGVVVSAWFLDADSFTDAVLVNVGLADGSERWAVDRHLVAGRQRRCGVAGTRFAGRSGRRGPLHRERSWRAAAVKVVARGRASSLSVVDAMDGSGRPWSVPRAKRSSRHRQEPNRMPARQHRVDRNGPLSHRTAGAVKALGADGHELWRWVERRQRLGDGLQRRRRCRQPARTSIDSAPCRSSSSTARQGPRCGSDRRRPCRPSTLNTH